MKTESHNSTVREKNVSQGDSFRGADIESRPFNTDDQNTSISSSNRETGMIVL